MPTWGSTADKENLNLFKVEDNIDLGVRILKGYVARFGLWDGVMRYRGWIRNPESSRNADEYAQKVRRIYQPDFVTCNPATHPHQNSNSKQTTEVSIQHPSPDGCFSKSDIVLIKGY